MGLGYGSDKSNISSADILDATIVNADISASAAIAVSKLEALAAGSMILGDGSGGPAELTIGAANTVLWSNGTTASWTGTPVLATSLGIGATATQLLDVVGSSTPAVAVYDSSAATADRGGRILLQHTNSGSTRTTYASLGAGAQNGGVGTEAGDLWFNTANAGTLAEKMRLLANGTLRIGVASTATGTLTFAHASVAFTTSFAASSTTAATVTYILPTNKGTAGQVLTDAAGDGILSWSSPSTTTAFSAITGATNTTAAMVVGDGATLNVTLTVIGTALTSGCTYTNSTAAAAGAQQYSPAVIFAGRGWKTNATAASQVVNGAIQLVPVEGAAAPTTRLTFSTQINGGGYTDQGYVGSDGIISGLLGFAIGGTTVLHATGTNSIALGATAANTSQTTSRTTSIGVLAGRLVTSGNDNTFLGYQAGTTVTTGVNNVALGSNAWNSGTGSNVVAVGVQAGINLSTGGDNVFVGHTAGGSITTGTENVAMGENAGVNLATSSTYMVCLGSGSGGFTSGIKTDSIALGGNALVQDNNQLVIGGSDGSDRGKITTAYFGNGVTHHASVASAANVVFNTTGGNGTDKAGGTFGIAGGKGTGTGTPGTVYFLVSDPGTTGTTLQTLATRMTINYTGIDLGAANTQASASGLTAFALKGNAHTVTLTGTTQVTAASGTLYLDQMTLTDASAVTVDAHATLYIKGPSVAAGSVTLTAPWSVWVDAGNCRFDGNLDFSAADATNIVLGTTTGTKIGTATSQKLGFFNATPVIQQASIADPSGGAVVDAEARTAVIALITRLETFGLIATV